MNDDLMSELGFPAEKTAVDIPEPVTEAVAQPESALETTEQRDERLRDERGRFTAKDEAEQPRPEPQSKPEDTAFAAMRRRIAELERQQQPKQEQHTPTTPDEVALVQHLNASEERVTSLLALQIGSVEQASGIIDAAKQFFHQLDPQTQHQIRSSSEPYAALITQYQTARQQYEHRQRTQQAASYLEQVGFPTDNLDPKAIEEWAVSFARQKMASDAQPPPQKQAPPPRSLAASPSAGGDIGSIPVGPGEAFRATFG